MNPGTAAGGGITRVGSDGLFMIGLHIAHDCIIGDNVIMANNASLGGHVIIGDYTIMGGMSAVHQFCRLVLIALLVRPAWLLRMLFVWRCNR